MTDTPMKRCSKCGFECVAVSAAAYFYSAKRTRDGFEGRCKACIKASEAERRKSPAVKARKNELKRKKYHEDAEYRAKKLEKQKLVSREWRQKHRKEVNAYANMKYHSDADYRANALRIQHNRAAIIRGADGGLTKEDRTAILKAHTDSKGHLRCAKCGGIIKGSPHFDHFIPIKLGGSSDPGNYRVMHPRCNQKKNAKHPFEIGMLI